MFTACPLSSSILCGKLDSGVGERVNSSACSFVLSSCLFAVHMVENRLFCWCSNISVLVCGLRGGGDVELGCCFVVSSFFVCGICE